MNEALGLPELLAAGLAGAAVVSFGGLYALFLAWGLMRRNRLYRGLACASFLMLALAFAVLSEALRLDRLWNAAIVFLLVAYLVAPYLIWRLTAATHAGEHALPHSASSIGRSTS